MSKIVVKEDIVALLKSFGITEGSLVCLQANLSKYGNIIGGYHTLIDAILDVVGETGCIMMPTFSFSTLDPSSYKQITYPYEDWKKIKENMIGFHTKQTPSSIYTDCFYQFMRFEGSIRTKHPVYSFAFLGNYDESWIKQTMNYPISFGHVLKGFVQKKAFNIIMGDELSTSVLLPAIAKTVNEGVVEVQKAYMKQNKRNVGKTYLNVDVSKTKKNELLDYCYMDEKLLNFKPVYCLSIDNLQD